MDFRIAGPEADYYVENVDSRAAGLGEQCCNTGFVGYRIARAALDQQPLMIEHE
jgi:hypothetical protein